VGRGSDPQSTIRGKRVLLRPYLVSDYLQWAELRARSREHLRPWEPVWPKDDLTRSAFRRRIRHYQREAREDLSYAFGVFDERGTELRGGLTLTNVRRGVTQSASLGYWLGLPYVGRGLMTDAVHTAVVHAFDDLRLHRIEAASMPSNTGSINVLERVGFVREGFARRYLKINGVWQDHILFALLADDIARGTGDE
jgi:ribosomal-protein-alanine N-acetyltransferase